jgi:hypothetical protein
LNRFILAAALLAAALFSASPDLYDRDRPLHTLETVWFDLIFPEESADAAHYLASFADDMYAEVTALLGTTPRHRLPVVITPDHEWISGYFANFPYLRIVLYQAAIDPDSTVGNFKDDLRSLFMHELTHAVSLTIRGPVQETLVGIFGSPLGLSVYTTPLNFVEGVTVSFESLGGFGRTTDPLAGALIRQDLHEGKFKSFVQTMGNWDRHPGRTLYYIYGGYFSRYLQERFGMENYARLWQCLGSGMLTRPLDDILFVQGHFRKVYGISLKEAWADFGKAMTPQKPVMASGPLITGLSAIDALASDGTHLYWADSADGAVLAHDTIRGLTRRLFPTGALVTRLAPGLSGSRMLVSATAYEGGYARLSIHEWDETSGTLARLPYTGLRDASYLPRATSTAAIQEDSSQSFLAIMTQGYETSLVLVRDGAVETLLEGNRMVSYASPVAGSDGFIHVLAKENGVVSVLRFRLNGLGVADLQRLNLPDGLGWIRYLSLDGGVLRLSWDDEAFYRLAELDGEVLRYQTVPTSGGVHQAVGVQGTVYHLGHFSEGTAVCTLPAEPDQLGFVEAPAVWEPADKLLETPSIYRILEGSPEFGNPEESTLVSITEGSPEYDGQVDLPGTRPFQIRPYSSLPWLLPRFWHPVIAGDADGLSLAGAAVYFADPIERVSGYLSGGWNPRTETPGYDAGLEFNLTPLLLRITLRDEFSLAASDAESRLALRQGNAGLALTAAIQPFAGGRFDFGLSGAIQGWAGTLDETDRYGNWDLALAYTSLYAIRQDLRQVFGKPGLHRGYSLGAALRSLAPVLPATDSPLFGFEVQVAEASSFLGLELAGYAGFSLSDGLLYGPAGATMQTAELGEVSIQAYPRYEEFTETPAGAWHVQSEGSLRLFSFEVQQAAGPLYIRRLDLRSGSRAILTSGTDKSVLDWSIFSRLELAFSPALGALALARPVAWVEVWYRPLDETWGLGYVRELSF